MNPVWSSLIVDDVDHCNTLHFITTSPCSLAICVLLAVTSSDDEDALILKYKTEVTDASSKLLSLLESLLLQVKDETSAVVDEYNGFVPHHSSQHKFWLRQTLSEFSAQFCRRVKLLDTVEFDVIWSFSAKNVNRRLVDGTGCAAHCTHQLSDFCPLVGHCVVLLNAV